MRLAEGALYRAKRSGRNRCVVYSSFVDAPLSLQEEAERARTAGLANTSTRSPARSTSRTATRTSTPPASPSTRAVLAREFGMSEEEIDQIRTAGILHDVGKVGVADAVLLKPARLTDDEFLEMQRHSTLGRDIVAGAGMPEIAEWVLYLHERWDGRGYPDRLEGDEIPLASRVLGVADAFEAMTSSRLYRRGMAVEKALASSRSRPASSSTPTSRCGWSSSSARARSRSARSASSTSPTTGRRRAPRRPPRPRRRASRCATCRARVPRGAKRAGRGNASKARANSAS